MLSDERVGSGLAVRMLWELASAEHAPSGKLTSSQRNAMKRKRQQQGLG
jgi:hypothetical protein